MTRPTRLRVGQLVVSGLTPAAAHRATAAFEGELRRLAGGGGAEDMTQAPQEPMRLRVSAGDPHRIGIAAARALHAKLHGGKP